MTIKSNKMWTRKELRDARRTMQKKKRKLIKAIKNFEPYECGYCLIDVLESLLECSLTYYYKGIGVYQCTESRMDIVHDLQNALLLIDEYREASSLGAEHEAYVKLFEFITANGEKWWD